MRYVVNPDLFFGPDPCLSLFTLAPGVGIAKVREVDLELVESLNRVGNLLQSSGISEKHEAVAELLKLGYLVPRTDDARVTNPFLGFAPFHSVGETASQSRGVVVRRIEEGSSRIAIVDGALAPEQVEAIQAWLELLPYRQHDVDSSDASQFKHWICPFSEPAQYARAVPVFQCIAHIGWTALGRAAKQVDKMHAYSVPYGDVQSYHRDYGTVRGLTVVYHGNATWSREWSGEMIFCDGEGSPRHAIEHRPGRIIAFNGDLLHRAGVPSRNALASRRSLVFQTEDSAPLAQ